MATAEQIAAVMNRMQALEAEILQRPTQRAFDEAIARFRQEVIGQNDDRNATLHAIRDALGRARDPADTAAGGRRPRGPKVDSPAPWSGDKDKIGFQEYAFKIKNYIMSYHPIAVDMFQQVEAMKEHDPDKFDDDLEAEQIERVNVDLYTTLAETTIGRPNLAVRNTSQGQGLRAWFNILQLFDPKNTTDKNTAYSQVAQPTRRAIGAEQFKEMLATWENQVLHYESRFGALPEETKVSALKMLIPAALLESRYRGKLNLDFITLKKEVELWAGDTAVTPAGRTANGGPTPMDLDAVRKQEGETPQDQSWTQEEYTATPPGQYDAHAVYQNPYPYYEPWYPVKGKGKDNKGGKKGGKSTGKGEHKGKGGFKGKGSDKGKGKGKTSRECWNCGGKGHLAAQCPSWAGPGKGLSTLEEEQADARIPQETHEDADAYGEHACWTVMSLEEFTAWERVRKGVKDERGIGQVTVHNKYDPLTRNDEDEIELNVVQAAGDWIKVTGTLDSGAAESVCPMDFMPMLETSAPKDGRTYVAATGTRIKDQGAKKVEFTTCEGRVKNIMFRRTNVMKPLIAMSKVEQAGNMIVLNGPENSYVECKKTKERTKVRKQDGVYVIDMWINTGTAGPVFGRQGR
jgi:hypothetical protein